MEAGATPGGGGPRWFHVPPDEETGPLRATQPGSTPDCFLIEAWGCRWGFKSRLSQIETQNSHSLASYSVFRVSLGPAVMRVCNVGLIDQVRVQPEMIKVNVENGSWSFSYFLISNSSRIDFDYISM